MLIHFFMRGVCGVLLCSINANTAEPIVSKRIKHLSFPLKLEPFKLGIRLDLTDKG